MEAIRQQWRDWLREEEEEEGLVFILHEVALEIEKLQERAPRFLYNVHDLLHKSGKCTIQVSVKELFALKFSKQ